MIKYKNALKRATQEDSDLLRLRMDGTLIVRDTGVIFASSTVSGQRAILDMISSTKLLAHYEKQDLVETVYDEIDIVTWQLFYPKSIVTKKDIEEWVNFEEAGGGPGYTLNLNGWGIIPRNMEEPGWVKVAFVWDPENPETWCDDNAYYGEEE